MPPTRRRAFTLVELLVVIGIIAVLIALLMPVLGKARQQAREVRCASNLRSIGQALVLYVQQYHYYPGAMGTGPPHGMCAIWPTRLRAVTGAPREAFNCPSQDERFWWTDQGPGWPNTPPKRVTSADWFGYEVGEMLIEQSSYFTYGYNLWGVGDRVDLMEFGLGHFISTRPADREGFMRQKEIAASRVKRASEMIAVGDSTVDGHSDAAMDASANLFGDPPYGWPGTIHRGGANILFCDGHVTWYLQKDLVDFSGPQGQARRRMWHNDHEP